MGVTAEDEIRGSSPVMTAKDVLLEVRGDVKLMAGKVDILVSQNLNERVSALEKAQWKVAGIAAALGAVAGVVAGRLPF